MVSELVLMPITWIVPGAEFWTVNLLGSKPSATTTEEGLLFETAFRASEGRETMILIGEVLSMGELVDRLSSPLDTDPLMAWATPSSASTWTIYSSSLGTRRTLASKQEACVAC